MNYFSIEEDLSHELEFMSPAERAGRIRGEHSDLISLLPLSFIQTKKDLLKLVASEWRQLSDKARAFWEEESRKDKVRYVLVRPAPEIAHYYLHF